MSAIIDLTFPHLWQAGILAARPLILPPRHFVYPLQAEEVERGALEVLVRPAVGNANDVGSQGPGLGRPPGLAGLRPWGGDLELETREGAPSNRPHDPFLATCALGFRDSAAPTGLWSAPKPEELCAVAGGYAYLIDTTAPQRFTMLPYRPVLEVRAVPAHGLLLFVGHRAILAWGCDGQAWESERLSDEGVTINSVDNSILRGTGWEMRSDKETPFALDLRSGALVPAQP